MCIYIHTFSLFLLTWVSYVPLTNTALRAPELNLQTFVCASQYNNFCLIIRCTE